MFAVLCKTTRSNNSGILPQNDWFLNSDIIDSYPGCKWKPPQHHSRQPALVLLGRWEATCGKMKAIRLDGAMSSECRVWCKQHLSRYDEPWTLITHATPTENPQWSEPQPPLTDSVVFWKHNCIHLLCTDHSQITMDPCILECGRISMRSSTELISSKYGRAKIALQKCIRYYQTRARSGLQIRF